MSTFQGLFWEFFFFLKNIIEFTYLLNWPQTGEHRCHQRTAAITLCFRLISWLPSSWYFEFCSVISASISLFQLFRGQPLLFPWEVPRDQKGSFTTSFRLSLHDVKGKRGREENEWMSCALRNISTGLIQNEISQKIDLP